LFMAGLILAGQAWALHSGSENWRTLAFTAMCFSQLAYVMAIRSEERSLFRMGVSSNRPLLGTVVLTALLQLVLIYVPAFQSLFKTTPLTMGELAVAIGIAALAFCAVEIEKRWLRKRRSLVHAQAVEQSVSPFS
jgi:Ca2+-transporting ATPase